MECPNCGAENSDSETYCQKCAGLLRPVGKTHTGPDWEFWGNKNAWKMIGIGTLLIVIGIPFILYDMMLGFILVMPGFVLIMAATTYIVYVENWNLLAKKNESARLAEEQMRFRVQHEGKYCPSCSQRNDLDSAYCKKCGLELNKPLRL